MKPFLKYFSSRRNEFCSRVCTFLDIEKGNSKLLVDVDLIARLVYILFGFCNEKVSRLKSGTCITSETSIYFLIKVLC